MGVGAGAGVAAGAGAGAGEEGAAAGLDASPTGLGLASCELAEFPERTLVNPIAVANTDPIRAANKTRMA